MKTPGELALDTSVCVAHLRREDSAIGDTLRAATELWLPLTALGELRYGFERSGKDPRAAAQLSEIQSMSLLLKPDEETAYCFGELKNHLSKKGKLIPEGDLWIAATAKSHGLTLYCRDAHFDHLSDIMDILQAAPKPL